MGQHYSHSHTLTDGAQVGYSFLKRKDSPCLRVRFVGPDGKLVDRSTGCDTKGEAHQAAKRLIAEAFRPVLPPEPTKAGWDTVLKELAETPGLRPDSVRDYTTAVRALRRVFPELAGPADVTETMGHRFSREMQSGTYARGKASDAKQHKRSQNTCKTYLRSLRTLWSKQFRHLGHVKDNPWLCVPYPNVDNDRRVNVPEEEDVAELFEWLEVKHAGWETPRLWVQVKMLAGCRTLDLCKARTADLDGDTLTLPATTTKTRTERSVPLPAEMATALRRLAGPQWLWERSVEESKVHRWSPKAHSKTEYSPSTWRHSVENIFREFNKSRPGKPRLRPHDLRARAVTLLARKYGVDATAHILGMSPQTVRHYLDKDKAFNSREMLRGAADELLPKARTIE